MIQVQELLLVLCWEIEKTASATVFLRGSCFGELKELSFIELSGWFPECCASFNMRLRDGLIVGSEADEAEDEHQDNYSTQADWGTPHTSKLVEFLCLVFTKG